MFVVVSGFSQDNNGFFQRLRNIFVVHDTVFIYADSIAQGMESEVGFEDLDEEEVEEEEDEE